jgi:hypothetical protein
MSEPTSANGREAESAKLSNYQKTWQSSRESSVTDR